MEVLMIYSMKKKLIQITFKEGQMAKTKRSKLNEVIFKSYQDVINSRMKAGHDVSGLTKRLNKLIAQYSN